MGRLRKLALWGFIVCGVLVVTYLFARGGAGAGPSAEAQQYFSRVNIKTASGDFIPASQLGNSDYCGHCHTDIFQQWNASAHHFASFNNPFYRKVALDVEAKHGPEVLKFCGNCHDPIPMVSDEMENHKIKPWSANAGITCLACHRITEVHGPNGNYVLSAPVLHPFAITDNPWLQKAHGVLVKLTPWLHRKVLTKAIYSKPEFCATCHTLVIPKSINGVDDFVIQDEYGHWQNSRFSGHYGVDVSHRQDDKTCNDCHMPLVESDDPAAKDGLIRSHRFPGGNTALPQMNRDFTHLKALEEFLQAQRVEVHIVGIRTSPQSKYRKPEETIVVKGEARVELAVRVDNVGVGHTFPAGTVDSNEAWLEFIVRDRNGFVFHHSGGLDTENEVSKGSHKFRTTFVDAEGNTTDRRTTTTHAVAESDSTVIAAGASLMVYETLKIPADAVLPFELQVRMNWRKYSPKFIHWVFDGRKVPDLPITQIAQTSIVIGGKPGE